MLQRSLHADGCFGRRGRCAALYGYGVSARTARCGVERRHVLLHDASVALSHERHAADGCRRRVAHDVRRGRLRPDGQRRLAVPRVYGGRLRVDAQNPGASCTDVGNGASFECVPEGIVLPSFAFEMPLASKGTLIASNPPGLLCPNQPQAGAFGSVTGMPPQAPAADRIRRDRTRGGRLDPQMQRPARLASVFCIPMNGNAVIDGALGFPGPAALSLPVTYELAP